MVRWPKIILEPNTKVLPQRTAKHHHPLHSPESGKPKIWTIVQIFGLAKKRALKFPYLGSALQSFKKKSVRRPDIYRGLAADF
jgi:hypothetical protein